MEKKDNADKEVPGYKLELKYEQDFYCDRSQVCSISQCLTKFDFSSSSQIVFIEEMGVKDMEGMTVSRADFWAVAKENLERGDQEEKERESKAKVTYMEAKKREKRDPRKRKIGNAGISVINKRPSMETGGSSSRAEEGDDEYSYMEEEELVDEREERWVEEEEEERWREQQEEEEDYHYHDGDGLV